MSASELVASLVNSLAWPIAVVAVVFIFRGAIGNLIRTVTQLRYGSFEINFQRQLAELQAQAPAPPSPPPPADGQGAPRAMTPPAAPPLPQEKVTTVAQVSPAAAVSLAWNEIEAELREAAQRTGIDDTNARDSGWIIETLHTSGGMPVGMFGILQGLQRLRNEAVQASPQAISVADAEAYGRFANDTIERIKTVGR